MSQGGDNRRWTGHVIRYEHDGGDKVVEIPRPGEQVRRCEHDETKRVFRITEHDGKVAENHDRAVRFLVVAPDPQTCELTPVLRRGKPVVTYLCREAGS